LMKLAREKTVDQILADPEVRKHVDRLKREETAFREHLTSNSRQNGNIVLTDVRGLRDLPSGNRFLIYELFPNANVSIRVADGRNKEFISIQIGHSILKRDCKTSVGDLLAEYGGGGHQGAGTCQVSPADADRVLAQIMETLHRNG
jgi:nanoRNase/pAp phosphatase (c-di-AMP/oligoRNAs hydrolase)